MPAEINDINFKKEGERERGRAWTEHEREFYVFRYFDVPSKQTLYEGIYFIFE